MTHDLPDQEEGQFFDTDEVAEFVDNEDAIKELDLWLLTHDPSYFSASPTEAVQAAIRLMSKKV